MFFPIQRIRLLLLELWFSILGFVLFWLSHLRLWILWLERITRHSEFKSLLKTLRNITLMILAWVLLLSWVEKKSMIELAVLVVQTITTVGYGVSTSAISTTPITARGWLVTLPFMLILPAYLVVAITKIASFLRLKDRLLRGGYMPFPKKNGFVLLGVPEMYKLKRLLSQIRGKHPKAPICIITETVEEIEPKLNNFVDLHYINKSTLDEDLYKSEIALKNQRAVIVYPCKDKSEPDLLTNAVVRFACKYTDKKKTNILYVVIDSTNKGLFEGVWATAINDDSTVDLIGQSCESPNIAEAFQNTINTENGPIVHNCVVTKINNCSWLTFSQSFLEVCATETDVPKMNLFGLAKDEISTVTPDFNTKINPGNEILICVETQNEFDWEELESQIVEILTKKKEKTNV